MMQIVEGGCIDPRGGSRLRAKLTKQGLELLAARVRRFVYVVGSPWRAVRRVLQKARPSLRLAATEARPEDKR
jgi:hypothetical protein